MSERIQLSEWKHEHGRIKLIYRDGDFFYVNKEDFDRAFGCIVSGEKEEIKRDFEQKID